MTSKAVFSLPCRAAVLQRACTWCLAWVLCISSELLQSCMKCKISKVYCSDKQGCFQLALQSSTVTKGMHRVLGLVAVNQCWVFCRAVSSAKSHRCIAVTSKAVFSLPCRAALLQKACTGCLAWLLCISVGLLQTCMKCKIS